MAKGSLKGLTHLQIRKVVFQRLCFSFCEYIPQLEHDRLADFSLSPLQVKVIPQFSGPEIYKCPSWSFQQPDLEILQILQQCRVLVGVWAPPAHMQPQECEGLSIACPLSSHLPVISITTDPWGWRFCREVEQFLLLCNDPNKMSIVNINVTLKLVNGWGMLKIAWSKRQDGRTVLDGIDWHWFKFFICKGHYPWVSPVPWNVAVLVAVVLVFCIVDGTKVQIVVAAGLFVFLNVWNIIPIYLWAMDIWRIAHPFLRYAPV